MSHARSPGLGRAGTACQTATRPSCRATDRQHPCEVVMSPASSVSPGVVVGLDIGGTATNATVLDGFGRFLVDDLCETPSRVLEGPPATLEALLQAFDRVLALTGLPASAVVAVGLDTPGPASADGVISS